MEDKAKRGSNFTQKEVLLLVKLLKGKNEIIANRRLDKVSWQQKNEAWEDITFKFNAESPYTPRSTHMLRKKYDNLKIGFKEKYDLITNTWKTPFDISLTDEIVRDLIVPLKPENYNSVKFENEFASDIEDSKSFISDHCISPELIEIPQIPLNHSNGNEGSLQQVTAIEDVDVLESSPMVHNESSYNEPKKNDIYERELEILQLKKQHLQEEHDLKVKLMKDKHMLTMKSLELDILIKKKQLEQIN